MTRRRFGGSNPPTRPAAGGQTDQSAVHREGSEDPRPVLVAVDDATADRDVLDWAAAEAVARRCPLRIVHVFTWPIRVDSFGAVSTQFGDPGAIAAGDRVLARAAWRARLVAPELSVTTYLQSGAPVPAICREGRNDALIVFGRDQPTGLVRWLGGSRTQHIARLATCPVAVVGFSHDVRPSPSAARVVVGIGKPGDSSTLLDFALRAARRRRVGVSVLHALSARGRSAAGRLGDEPIDVALARCRRIDAAVSVCRAAYPDVDVRQRLIHGPAGPALVAESAGAALLVVGSPAHGPLRGALLGSTSKTVLSSAHCPVAVVKRRST